MSVCYNGKDRVPKGATTVHLDPYVTAIEDRAFFDCSFLTSIVIPTNITKIGRYAFFGCTSLKSIIMSSSITEIGVCAFYDCMSLQSIDIPPSIAILDGYAFSGCTSLRSITIPPSVETISGYAFFGCSSLISVFVPPSVKYIGNGAFQGCTSLSSIAIPPSVQSIGYRAFHSCEELERAVPGKKSLTHWLKERFTKLPLQDACYSPEVLCKEITNIISIDPASIEAKDELGLTALHVLACNSQAETEVIRQLLQICPELAKMSTFNGMSPISLFLRCKGFSFDETQGRLPLCEALEQGMTLQVMKRLFTLDRLFCMEQWERDEENEFYPFIVAASRKECSLDVIYTLARESVELLCPYPY